MKPGSILALALALVLAGCGAPARPVPRQLERYEPGFPLLGFNTAAPAPVEAREVHGDPVEDLKRARDLGANAVRVALRWDWLQPEPGPFNTTIVDEVDRLFAAARKLHMGVVVSAVFTPCWASSARGADGTCDPSAGLYPPADPETYGTFARRVVGRWGKDMSGFEVWNEPNLPDFWKGTPAAYVELVRAAAENIRSSPYADLPVVGGAVSGADVNYLNQLFDAGIGEWSDAISIHPYDLRLEGPGYADPSVARPEDMRSFAYAVPAVRALMVGRGDEDPIWITELGYPDCPATPFCVTQEAQADYLVKALNLSATWPYVHAFFIYNLRDWAPQNGRMENRLGVLNQDGSEKPAAAAVAGALKALAPAQAEPDKSGRQ